MLFQASGVSPLKVELRARFAAGAVAARLLGRADMPHWKHKIGSPFLSRRRCGSRSSNWPWRLEMLLVLEGLEWKIDK